MTGSILFFNRQRGFGFVAADPASSPKVPGDIFVHYSQIPAQPGQKGFRTIDEGAKIEFDLGERNGRPVALNVRRIGASSESR